MRNTRSFTATGDLALVEEEEGQTEQGHPRWKLGNQLQSDLGGGLGFTFFQASCCLSGVGQPLVLECQK